MPTIFANRLMLQLIGPIRRCGAFLWDVAFTYILHSCLLSTEQYQQFLFQVEMQLGQWRWEFFPASMRLLLPMFVSFYCLLVSFRVVSACLFGTSLGTFLLGGRVRSNFLWARLGGMMRELIGGLTAPFLLGNLPLLFGKKSLQELISFTKLQARPTPGYWVLFNFLVLFPLTIVLALFSPLLENLTFIDGVQVAVRVQKAPRLTNTTDFGQFHHFQSHFFRFTTFTDLDQGRFRLLPLFTPLATNKDQAHSWSPALIIYDGLQHSTGVLSVEGESNLLAILQKSPVGNPLFGLRYPHLQQLLATDPQSWSIVDEVSGEKRGLLLDSEQKQELKDYLWSAMELNPLTLLDHLLHQGPFVRGHILVRNRLLNFIDRRYPLQVSLEHIGDSDFLQIFQQDEEGSWQQTLIALEFPLAPIFRLRWQSPATKESAEDFFAVFWAKAQWYLDGRHIVDNPVKNAEINGLQVLDFFLPNPPFSGKELEMEKIIVAWIEQQMQLALQSEDHLWQQNWQRSLASLVERVKSTSDQKYRFSSNFLQTLAKILQQINPTNVEKVML